MTATMAREGGWVQLEQSDMSLALNMAKMAKGGFSHAAIEENTIADQDTSRGGLSREEAGCWVSSA